MNLDKYSDKDIVTATLVAEAGGEPFAGQVMCGETIANRAAQTGLSARYICLQPRQFSCWNNRGTMEIRMQTMRSHKAWGDCVKIAESICRPGYVPVSPVTHYFAWQKIKPPKWAKAMTLVAIVGGHKFFKEAGRVEVEIETEAR